MPEDEDVRAARLLDAQAKAAELFAAVEERGLIAPGVREIEASDAIRDLAADMYGVSRHWHKRIVRAGVNTLQPYRQNPPDRAIGADDIVFCDFGPIFEEWEADFGRTFVLGDDPGKLRIRDTLPVVWRAAREHFDRRGGRISRAGPTSPASSCSRTSPSSSGRPAGSTAAPTPGIWSVSSRTRRSLATRSAPTSRRAATSRCGGRTGPDAAVTGSSRSTWSTATGGSAASTKNCWTSATDGTGGPRRPRDPVAGRAAERLAEYGRRGRDRSRSG
jgi:hypothetical protein